MKKRIVCLILGLTMILSQTFTVFATTEQQLKQQKSQAESRLNATNDTIDDLSAKQMQVQAEINSMDADMVDLMIQIEATKSDISSTEQSITDTQNNITAKEVDITDKQGEIDQTQAELVDAEADRDQQYQDMKKRIKYIYENGGDSAWINAILGSGDFSTMLNRAEYAQSMHEYDRDSLNKYIETVNQVTELKTELETQKTELERQKSELENQKSSLETQKASLESQKNDLENQQSNLQVRIEEKKATSSDYESQIAAAQRQAAEISSLIAQQESELNRLAEERRQAEEAARRAAAEEAARRAAAEEEARRAAQEAQNSRPSSGNTNNSSSNSGSTNGFGSSSNSGSTSNSGSSNSGSTSGSGSSSNTGSSSGVSGSAIVAYADQFVGNPYVWGGNSLTNGIDCSHFVWQVLKNTGAYSGGYTTSAGWRSLGRPVSSLAEAKAGDVICYSGHVAIYDGYGGIVEAKGTKWGITHDRRADHTTILAIRRFT